MRAPATAPAELAATKNAARRAFLAAKAKHAASATMCDHGGAMF
jgi:hypothetical protein